VNYSNAFVASYGSGTQTQNKMASYRVLIKELEQGARWEEAEGRLKEALHFAYNLDREEAEARSLEEGRATGFFQ
jgi:hypothetical protein